MTRVVADRTALAAAVTFASRALPRSAAIPTLNGIRLSGGKKLKVSAFDYETYAEAHVLNGNADEIDLLLPGKALGQYLSGMSGDMVTIDVDQGAAVIACGRSKVRLQAMRADEYPSAPEPPPLLGSVPAEDLADAVAAVKDCASNDSALAVLQGIAVKFGDQLTLCATDRYRVAVRTLDWNGGGELESIVPVPMLESAKLLTGDVRLGSDDGLFLISDDDRTIITRLIEGAHPKAVQLIEGHKGRTDVTVDREEAVKAFAWLIAGDNRSKGTAHQCDVEIGTDSITVALFGLEGINPETSIDAKVDGEPMNVRLSAKFMVSLLDAAGGAHCLLSFAGPAKTIRVTSEDSPELRSMFITVRA